MKRQIRLGITVSRWIDPLGYRRTTAMLSAVVMGDLWQWTSFHSGCSWVP
jgi:hypothetical protein